MEEVVRELRRQELEGLPTWTLTSLSMRGELLKVTGNLPEKPSRKVRCLQIIQSARSSLMAGDSELAVSMEEGRRISRSGNGKAGR